MREEPTTPALEGADLSIGYGEKIIASGLSIRIYPGDVASLLGPNGVGKSTLIKTLTGELEAVEGIVYVFGKDVESYSRKELSRLLAIVTTDSVLAGGLTVEELVGLGRQPHTGFFGRMDDDDRKATEEAMRRVGIIHKREAYVAELSDGERQKAMIAKALAQETAIIVLDEPFSYLDVAARIEILSLLKEIAAGGKAILFSSHDVSQALRMASKAILFTPSGELISGTPARLIAERRLPLLFPRRNVVFSEEAKDFIAAETGSELSSVKACNVNECPVQPHTPDR